MPTYEYACKSCGQHLDVVQSFRDDPLTVCPSCGGALRKVFGSIGIAFKGSGFYRTDSRPAAKASSASDAKSSESSAKEPAPAAKEAGKAKGAAAEGAAASTSGGSSTKAEKTA